MDLLTMDRVYIDNETNISSYDHFIEVLIQAILAAKEALEKPIEERNERDILLIDNLCSLAHGFDAFPKSIRRALAAQAILIVIDEKGKELIVNNEELDSFCVLIFGECEQLNETKTASIRSYQIGDSFGVCKPTTETIRFKGHMITKCENCAFLCVKRDDFYTILTDPANYPNKKTIKHRDSNGNIICVSQFNIEKKSSGPIWANYHMQSFNNPSKKIILPDGHIITKATEDYLLMSLFDGYDRIDTDYVDDFLLLFRVFMTNDLREKERKLPPGMVKLCLKLLDLKHWLDVKANFSQSYRDKVVKIVLTWLSSYYHDFELNSEFSYLFFRALESLLEKLYMKNQLHLLHVTLSTKSKTRQVTISKSSREQPLNFFISGGYEKNCGVFVTHKRGSNCGDPYESFMNYLKPAVTPRLRQGLNHSNNLFSHDTRISAVPLREGDQILEVNGTNFSAIKLVEAQNKLDDATHLVLTVKYNPSAYHEMLALSEGSRLPPKSSVSFNSRTIFTFNLNQEFNSSSGNKQCDLYQPASPFSANFGIKSISVPKFYRSRLSALIYSSKQLFSKQIRDSTAQASNNIETSSRTSDNTSDTQSNDIELSGGCSKSKSIPDLTNPKNNKNRLTESGLSNIIKFDDLKTDNATYGNNDNNQMLVNVLRVFNGANNDSRYLLVHEETTAREVVMLAVKEFNLVGQASNFASSPIEKSSLNWYLYEVSVVPESRTIKQKCLSEQTNRLADRASLCSRFYIIQKKPSGETTRLDMGDDVLVNEILKENPPKVSLTSLDPTLLAVELTLSDFDKFRSIEPQQFVYDTFFDYSERNIRSNGNSGSSSADSASLKSSSSDSQDSNSLHTFNKRRTIPKSWMKEYQDFADISNKEMFWVVCEILSERNIGTRVQIVKQFILVADVCCQLRNYNSMFAIISGLGHSCINRLKKTFEKLKPKYKDQLELMRSLFDPSKNMSNYRMCLSQSQPPAIPLFPQIKKDLTFTKEGRSIFIRESNVDESDDEEYSQETIKRRSRTNNSNNNNNNNNNLLSTIKSSTMIEPSTNLENHIQHNRSLSSYPAYTNGNNFNINNRQQTCSDYTNDNILVNFAEIRQFTERVKNVIYFSSTPYSNDLLTNTKDNQRNQAQIKKMYEESQMRKRIRHYIQQTLDSAIINQSNSSCEKLDQTDSCSSSSISSFEPKNIFNNSGVLNITFDEKTLYQRSLDIELEFNVKPPQQQQQHSHHATNDRQNNQHVPLFLPNQPQVPPAALNMHAPPLPPPLSATNSSPTLSKSSSLSSCSSFNNHMPYFHVPVRNNNLTTSVGKFGTESTESLRKLQALSENVDDWKPYHGNNNGANNFNANPNCNRFSNSVDQTSRSKGIVTSRIFPAKGNR